MSSLEMKVTDNSYAKQVVLGDSISNLEEILASTLVQCKQQFGSFKEKFHHMDPYPHMMIDGFFPSQVLNQILDDFSDERKQNWIKWYTKNEGKETSKGISGTSLVTQMFMCWLNSAEFIDQVKLLTGIDDLVPDPMFFGSGLHDMFRDGWLNLHADYIQHPVLPLRRRINLLIYINHDWDSGWGGELVLQDPVNTNRRASYPPLFNRTVIFPTTTETLHGVPEPLRCPVDQSRKLISIYYWSPIVSNQRATSPVIWVSKNQAQNRLQWMSQKFIRIGIWKLKLGRLKKLFKKPNRK
jgi:hypothetical protein